MTTLPALIEKLPGLKGPDRKDGDGEMSTPNARVILPSDPPPCGPGPYGYLVIPPGLNEESWTLESDPITEKERAAGYKCVALYARVDVAPEPSGERVILPAEATEEMMLAGMASAERMATATQGDAVIDGYSSMVSASPSSGRVTAEMLEAAARAICELDIRQARQFDTAPARLEEMLTAAVNHAWDAYIDDARAAIEAIGLTVEG